MSDWTREAEGNLERLSRLVGVGGKKDRGAGYKPWLGGRGGRGLALFNRGRWRLMEGDVDCSGITFRNVMTLQMK